MSFQSKEGMLHAFLTRGRFRCCLALDGLDNCSPNLFDGSDWTSHAEFIFHNAFLSALGKEEGVVGYPQTGVVLKTYQGRFARQLREKEQPQSTVSSMTKISVSSLVAKLKNSPSCESSSSSPTTS
jgi:hypothetical protein